MTRVAIVVLFAAFLDARPTIYIVSKRSSSTLFILLSIPRLKIAIERPIIKRVLAHGVVLVDGVV